MLRFPKIESNVQMLYQFSQMRASDSPVEYLPPQTKFGSKVMFSQVSVCLQGGVSASGYSVPLGLGDVHTPTGHAHTQTHKPALDTPGQQVGSTHPTGMLFCYHPKQNLGNVFTCFQCVSVILFTGGGNIYMISLPVWLHGPMFLFKGSPWTPPGRTPPAPDPLLECIIVLHWFGVDHLVYESNRL